MTTQLVILIDLKTGDTIAREMTASQIFEALRDGYIVKSAKK